MRTITIGRSNKCDIVIPDESVSRIHAEIMRNGNEFVYRDMGKNGTNIGGRMIHNKRVAIAPGTTVLLANRIPLPWAQVYAMLPGQGYTPSEQSTRADAWGYSASSKERQTPDKEDKLGIGWGILAFIIPLAGWIMYFVWKDETPKRASLAGTLGTISFVINIISILSA